MALTLAADTAIASANAQVQRVDESTTPGHLKIYSGTRPATADTAVTVQVLLIDFEFPDPAFGAAVDGSGGATATADVDNINTVQALATGTSTWFRITNGDGDGVYDGTVTDTTGSGDLKISSTAIVSGIDISVVSLTFTQPKA